MVEIDGSQGEGGGQVLRTALALAILTGQEVAIENIRLRRSQPGLAAQHLEAVKAAAAICKGQVEGAALRSLSLRFQPGEVRSGRYQFAIPTAGAATLLLQTVFYPLSAARAASSLTLSGGTHVPWSPTYDYLEACWLPAVEALGFDARLAFELAGFYPPGGGKFSAVIRPHAALRPLRRVERGKLLRIRGLSAVANLDRSIVDRQKRQALLRLEGTAPEVKIRTLELPANVKGTTILLVAEFESGTAAFSALGELGKPAERVADQAVDGLLAFLATGAAVDPHLTDQLLLPLALVPGRSELTTGQVTQHLLTNAAVIQAFLSRPIEIHGAPGEPGSVLVGAERPSNG